MIGLEGLSVRIPSPADPQPELSGSSRGQDSSV